MTATTAPAAPGTDLLERARGLGAAASARAHEIEQARTLPADLVSQLREAGLFRLTLPVALGGPAIEPRTIVEVGAEVSRADGATGWCLLLGNAGNALLAWLDRDIARSIVAREPDLVVASGQALAGHAVRDGARYRLTGRWPLASGCLHATWCTGGFAAPGGEPRVAYFPARQARVVDTWRAAGLAGAGSHDIAVEDLPVPVEHTANPYLTRAGHPDPLYRLTAYNLMLTVLSGFPLGVARRALDETRGQLAGRARPGGGPGWPHDPAVQVTLMRHETALRSARGQLLDTLDEVLAGLAHGEGTYAQRARLAAAVFHAFDTGRDAVLECFRLAGTGALFDRNPLQRCVRDIVAGAAHVALSAACRARVANALLGLQTEPILFGV